MKKHVGMSILLMAAISAPLAMADLIDQTTYVITFTGTNGPLPSSGSFTWDPDTGTFSGFSVTWQGIFFVGLGNSANFPTIIGSGSGCNSGSNDSRAVFLLLTSNDCGTTTWRALQSTAGSGFVFLSAGLPSPFPEAGGLAIGSALMPVTGDVFATGQFTATPVPEPSSAILMATVLLGAIFVAIRKRSSRVDGRELRHLTQI
jgi:hypothetical protein